MIKVWFDAMRPRTLGAGLAPVLIGGAMAYGDGGFHPVAFLAAAFGGILIQVGTNFANDAFDYLKGADTDARVGPVRATAQGLVAPRAMLIATGIVFALALVVGGYLTWRGGWAILAIGLSGIAAGILYTGGPRPLAYIGLGDVFVFIYFGPVAVAGTVYVQTLRWDTSAMIAGVAAGTLSMAILVVNNLRDRHTDAPAGKRTLAVRFGPGFVRAEWALCAVAALVVPMMLAPYNPGGLLALASFPLMLFVGRGVFQKDGAALNPYLGRTAGVLIVFSVLFSIGWVGWPMLLRGAL